MKVLTVLGTRPEIIRLSRIIEKLDRRGHHTHHVEGLTTGRWVLIDFVDFVVHLFHPETRSFYQLERLWDDAPELLISST